MSDQWAEFTPSSSGDAWAEFKPAAAPAPGILAKAIEPITSYPDTYSGMVSDATGQMKAGVSQARDALAAQPQTPAEKGSAAIDFVGGVGKTALGGLGYVAAPINAALRTFVGKPVEENTGIPKEIPEFAASLALPIPKKLPNIGGKVAEKAAPTIEELKGAASAGYKSPDVQSLEIKSPALSSFSEKLQADLNAAGIDENLAPKTFGILAKAAKAPPDSLVTGNNLESLRKMFGNAAGSVDATERKAAVIAKNSLSDLMGTVPQADVIAGDAAKASETIQEANANYSAAKRAELLDQKQLRAELRAAAANSGQNISNTMRQRLADVLLNPKEHRGWSEAELQTAEQIVRGSKLENLVRYAGNILGGGGGLGALMTTEAGVNKLGGVGALLAVPGAALKSLSNAMTMRQIGKLSEEIRSRAPLAQQMRGPVEDYTKAVEAYQQTRSPLTISRLAIASRNLANNLKDAGVNISPSELFKSLQGPMPAGASQEQQ